MIDRKKTYQVLRTGPDTAHTAEGEHYILSFEPNNGGWVCAEKTGGRVLYNGNASVFYNSRYWEIDFCFEDEAEETLQTQYEQEYSMSFDKVKTEALEIKENVTLVNGVAESKFSDEALEALTIAEAQKLQVYMDTTATVVGKYFSAKVKRMKDNVQKLQALLDSRV